MNYNHTYKTLVASIIANCESNRHLVRLLDEDFTLDPAGEWVNYKGTWHTRTFLLATNSYIYGTVGIKTWHGPDPWWIIQDREKKDEADKEVHALPGYRMVTTYEERVKRYAKKRAKEILGDRI